MNRMRNVLAAVVVAGGISAMLAGCGGGGGGGGGGNNGGGGGGGGQQPPPPQSPPVLTAASLTPQTVEGGKDTIAVTWSGTDADNDALTAFVRPAQGAPVSFTPTAPTSATSFSFQMPAVTADTSTTVELCLTDSKNPLVTRSFTIMVTKPASSGGGGGGGGGGGTTAPAITSVDLYNCAAIANVNSQIVEVYANTTGFNFGQITATLDGQPARIIRGFGQTPASFRVELPRMSTAGNHTLAVNFPGVATPSTTNILFGTLGDTWAVFNYTGGQALKIKIDSLGNASVVGTLLPGNGHTNVSIAQGASRERFWIAGQKLNEGISIYYCDAASGTYYTGDGVVASGGTNPGDTRGTLISIAALRDGSKAVVDWVDVFNTKGQGAGTHFLTVLDFDSTNNVPRVIKEIPLNLTGKIASGTTVTNLLTAELMIQSGTTIGNGVKQDWAVLGQQGAPYKLFMVPLESTGVQYLCYDLTVKPQVVECYEDIAQQALKILVFGQTGAGVSFQSLVVTHSIPAEPSGFGGTSKQISANTRDVLAAYTVNGSGSGAVTALICKNDNVYSLIDITAVPNAVLIGTPNSFGSGFSAQRATRCSGNGWFAVAANNASSPRCHIVQPNFTTFKEVNGTGTVNALVASENEICWEVRGTADNILVDSLTGTTLQQSKPEPSTVAAGNANIAAVSRSLAR